MASPTIIGTPVTGSASAANSLTVSITTPSGAQNKALIVICWASSGNNTAFSGAGGSVTFNGSNMTQIVNVVGAVNNGGIMYYLANPVATTANIVLTPATAFQPTDIVLAAGFVLQDCVQNSGTVVDVTSIDFSGVANTSSTPTVTTTVDNDLVIGWNSNRTGTALTTSQTFVTGTPFDPAGTNFSQAGVSYIAKTTAGAQDINFSWTGSDHFEAFATSLKYVAPTITSIPLLSLMGAGA